MPGLPAREVQHVVCLVAGAYHHALAGAVLDPAALEGGPTPPTDYAYDPDGNRLTRTVGHDLDETYIVAPGVNRLTLIKPRRQHLPMGSSSDPPSLSPRGG